MKIKMSDILKYVCSRCSKELGPYGTWYEDKLGNKYCSYRCKVLSEEK